MELSQPDIVRMRSALDRLRDDIEELVNAEGILPLRNSLAEVETRTFSRPKSVHTAQSQGTLLIEIAADHLTAFVKTITEPVETAAPWTCVRALLESSALASWLLDPAIDARTRVGRSLALRYEGLVQQVKFGRAAKLPELAKARARIDAVEQEAEVMGFPPLRDSRGRRSGIGQPMPSTTEIVRSMLDEEAMYRLLSAVAHGHHWAVQQLSFGRLADRNPPVPTSGVQLVSFEKQPFVVGMAYLIMLAATTFSRPAWYQSIYFGWNTEELCNRLESAFDRLHANEHVRFWRTPLGGRA